jgi:hypothetical protein
MTKQEKASKILNEISLKALGDNHFMKNLIQNPHETIIEFSNGEMLIPKDVKIIVENQTDNSFIYLNIPYKINQDDLELSDNQLEMVNGGFLSILAAMYVGYKVKEFICEHTHNHQ